MPRSAARAHTTRNLAIGSGLAAAALAGGLASPHEKIAVLVAALAVGVGVVIVDPTLVLVFAVPGTLLVQRLGGGAAGSSVDLSDVILFLGTALAVPAVAWNRARALCAALIWAVLYEAVLLLSILDNPNSHDAIEWGHRIFLVAGAMTVGWVVAVNGRAQQAIRILLVGADVLALVAVFYAVKLHFQPAQWGAYQKNYVGSIMWMVVVIAHLNPPWAKISVRLARVTKYLCLVALLASQSKQAIIALVLAILIATFRQKSLRRRSKAILLAVGPLAVFAYIVAAAEVKKYENHGYNSVKERSLAYSAAIDIWKLNPWFGQGPRWWYLSKFPGEIQPPNILLEAITESGILGAAALLLMIVAVMVVLARLPKEIATVALVLVLGRAVEGIFDLYWASADGALPWLVVGLSLGAADQARERLRLPGRARASGSEPELDLLPGPVPASRLTGPFRTN
jgi:O-antigen ligase